MINLEYWNGDQWTYVSEWSVEALAWISLGDDNANYRTVEADTGKVLTDKSDKLYTLDDVKEAYEDAYYEAAGGDAWHSDHNTNGSLIENASVHKPMKEHLVYLENKT